MQDKISVFNRSRGQEADGLLHNKNGFSDVKMHINVIFCLYANVRFVLLSGCFLAIDS